MTTTTYMYVTIYPRISKYNVRYGILRLPMITSSPNSENVMTTTTYMYVRNYIPSNQHLATTHLSPSQGHIYTPI